MGEGNRRLRVGVIGCGLIAQVMHIPNLMSMEERFELVALCDLSPEVLRSVAARVGITSCYTSYEAMLEKEHLDAVLVLTAGSHHPPTMCALSAGAHVFVEKPMCIVPAEGEEMAAMAESTGRVLMVGYHRRYDPAYEWMLDRASKMGDVRLVQSRTLESPLDYSFKFYGAKTGGLAQGTIEALMAADEALVKQALPRTGAVVRRFYRECLLDSMVHDTNGVRGLIGNGLVLKHASVRPDGEGAIVVMGVADGPDIVATWTNLPRLERYEQVLSVFGPEERLHVTFGPPFVRNAPATVDVEEGEIGGATWKKRVVVSLESGFARELAHFHDCIVRGDVCRTGAREGLEDVKLLQSIAVAASGT